MTDAKYPLALIVDDDVDIAVLLTAWLERLGYRVASATDLEKARAGLAAEPQIVLLDLLMPDQCSEHLERLLAALVQQPQVYFMSSATAPLVQQRQVDAAALGLAIAGFLRKPFGSTDLAQMLAR